MLINFAWAFPQLESFGVVCFVKCFDSTESCFKGGKSEKQRKGTFFKRALLTREFLPLSASVSSPIEANSTIRENFNGLFFFLNPKTLNQKQTSTAVGARFESSGEHRCMCACVHMRLRTLRQIQSMSSFGTAYGTQRKRKTSWSFGASPD